MFSTSQDLFKTSNEYLAAGVSSNLRLAMKPVPLFVKEADGVNMVDEDGNEYVDFIMAYGPQILGHSHPVIVEAIQEQVGKGQTFGAQHRHEIELAKKITHHLPSADLVSFCSTGTEAVQLALRLARAYTGRQKVVRFDGHYHGWVDTVNVAFTTGADERAYLSPDVQPNTAGQNIKALEDVIVLPWNDSDMLEKTLETYGADIAAVITEPIMCNSGCIAPLPGYLEKVRELTAQYGVVLIFDEVITGFRLGLGGAQEKLGVTPDLTTLGKAVAGGMPLSAVGGKKEIMALISESKVFHMGTLNGNPICTAAAIASIDFLATGNGAIYVKMNDIAEKLTTGMDELAAQYGLPLLINKHGPVFHTMFTAQDKVDRFFQFQQRDVQLFNQFAEALLYEGVLVRPSGLWYISAVHTIDDVTKTLDKVEQAFHRLKDHM